MPVYTTAASYRGDKLIFGGGGGFTGVVVSYVLYGNGKLYRQAAVKGQPEVFLKKINTATRKKLFAKADAIYRATAASQHPGNMTDFLEIDKSRKESKKYSWGEAGYQPPADLKELYNLLMALTNNK
jgi:hypothetical protein